MARFLLTRLACSGVLVACFRCGIVDFESRVSVACWVTFAIELTVAKAADTPPPCLSKLQVLISYRVVQRVCLFFYDKTGPHPTLLRLVFCILGLC